MRSFRRPFHVYGCKLTRDSLDAVWKTLTKDASERALSYVLTTQGNVTVREPTLDKLLAGLGTPARLTQIEFHMFDPAILGAGSEQDRSARVLVDAKSTFGVVSGPDETWVLGRAEELRGLLRGTRTRFAGNAWSSTIVAALFCNVLLGAYDLLPLPTKMPEAAEVSIVVAVLGISLALWRWLSRRNATRVTLTSDKRQPWSRADWIASGILAVTVLSLAVIAYQTWGPKS